MESFKRYGGCSINAHQNHDTAGSELVEDGLPSGSRHEPVKTEPVRLLVGYDLEVAQWVANELDCDGFGDCTAIGVVHEGKLIAGVVFFCYRPPTIEMAIASTSPKWFTRTVAKHVFDYPFNQLGCKRVTVTVDVDKTDVRKFDERIGFIQEGILKEAHPNGDAAIYRMLKSECRWIK